MRRRIAILLATVSAVTVLGFGLAMGVSAQQGHQRTVRSVTARFNSIQQAEKAGYVPFYICAEQPGVGTMGQHYVNFDLVGNPAIDPLQPEALVYEPRANGTLKLVALEWVQRRSREATAPTVLGQDMLYRTRAEPLRHRARLLRAALLAVQVEPAGCVRGLEPDGVLPRHRRQRRLTRTPVLARPDRGLGSVPVDGPARPARVPSRHDRPHRRPAGHRTRGARSTTPRLVRREDETESLAYFWVRFDGEPTPFEPGQYMTIGVMVDGRIVQRPVLGGVAAGRGRDGRLRVLCSAGAGRDVHAAAVADAGRPRDADDRAEGQVHPRARRRPDPRLHLVGHGQRAVRLDDARSSWPTAGRGRPSSSTACHTHDELGYRAIVEDWERPGPIRSPTSRRSHGRTTRVTPTGRAGPGGSSRSSGRSSTSSG